VGIERDGNGRTTRPPRLLGEQSEQRRVPPVHAVEIPDRHGPAVQVFGERIIEMAPNERHAGVSL
jgi:hypothetical protein